MKFSTKFDRMLPALVMVGDLILLLLILIGFRWLSDIETILTLDVFKLFVLNTLIYLLFIGRNSVMLHLRIVRLDQIVRNIFQRSVLLAAIGIPSTYLLVDNAREMRGFWTIYPAFFVLAAISRIILRRLLKVVRRRGRNSCQIVLIGNEASLEGVFRETVLNKHTGYNAVGYFADQEISAFSAHIPYLGLPERAVNYLHEHYPWLDQVFCGLSSTRSAEIMPIINFCENHLIRFYVVPNVTTYLRRRVEFETLGGDVPILSIRREPLEKMTNRIIKRTFDLVISTFALLVFFPPLLLIFGTWIKLTSRGPIFFKQKRSGEDGKEFWCYKFRSMRVNADADSRQATRNDPRKTYVGELMRRTNIDELPQLINVFLGDMSLVGPRPHMLVHTAQYSALIDKYMLRHQIKPGITGWAQVTGYRGETKELWQMEGRVQRDIWYMEHWTFWLDISIILRTIWKTGEKAAY